MPAEPAFVHLHVHSSYSLLEGALTIARLAELAKQDRQPALALTDTDNMFGALEFSEKLAGCGIQPIVGCAMAVDFGDLETRNGVAHGGTRRQPTRWVTDSGAGLSRAVSAPLSRFHGRLTPRSRAQSAAWTRSLTPIWR